MKFIDLFAGLGGFHLALSRLGHECVFASELDDRLRDLYQRNFAIQPTGDIRTVQVESIPAHQILCAGFPCQPFSKAGSQHGRNCPKWGDLFNYVLKILRHRKPRYLLLENVPNLSRHDNGDTWHSMRKALRRAGYQVSEQRLSPHQFGIPQIRERIYIAGSREGLNGFVWPATSRAHTSIVTALEKQPDDARPLSPQVTACLRAWQHFIRRYPKKTQLPSFPIWSMEFAATYPYEGETPHALGTRALCRYRGAHGIPLNSVPPSDRMLALPSYARTRERHFPNWKVQFIAQNRALYAENKHWIDEWLPRILSFPPSLQKLEWNCKGETRDIWRYVIQFRASGVRVKRPTTAPSLVAMTTTQVPIIAWQRRYMTARECATIQSLRELNHLPDVPTHAFKALGNAVNADVVELIARALLASPRSQPGIQRKRRTSRSRTASNSARPR